MRLKVLKLALNQNEKKYVWGKSGPDEFDCAGLIWYIYNELFDIDVNQNGIGKSTTTEQMTSNIGKLTLYAKTDLEKYRHLKYIKTGDILFFHRRSLNDTCPTSDNYYPGHSGLYLKDNQFIHALKTKQKVIISSLDINNYWLDILVGSKDIISGLDLENKPKTEINKCDNIQSNEIEKKYIIKYKK